MAVRVNNACAFTLSAAEKGELVLSAYVPGIYAEALREIMRRQTANHNGYGRLIVDVPFKPRSTGEGSQNHHLYGHLRQLAIHFGYSELEMKEVMKADVPEWPKLKRKVGLHFRERPVSEADVSSFVESRAIEWCHRIAAEEGIRLKEGKR